MIINIQGYISMHFLFIHSGKYFNIYRVKISLAVISGISWSRHGRMLILVYSEINTIGGGNVENPEILT